MIYQPADLRPKTLKTAVSGFFLLISVAYLERYLILRETAKSIQCTRDQPTLSRLSLRQQRYHSKESLR